MVKHVSRRSRRVVGAVVVGALAVGLVRAHAQAPAATETSSYTDAGAESRTGQWSGGSSAGLLFATPDGTAFGLNGNAEYFVTDRFSIGPLVQLGLTGDLVLVGASGQGKYYLPLPGTNDRSTVAVQGGIGAVHADFRSDDTSWLVPLGVEYGYAINPRLDFTASAMVNLTDLNTGAGSGADVMPALAFGLRF